MAKRIYALAKELNLNSKTLVEMCAKAGIEGKDSQLASLTDEEEATLRSFVSSGGGGKGTARASSPGAPVAPPTPTRPTAVKPTARPAMIASPRAPKPTRESPSVPSAPDRDAPDRDTPNAPEQSVETAAPAVPGPAIQTSPKPTVRPATSPPVAPAPTVTSPGPFETGPSPAPATSAPSGPVAPAPSAPSTITALRREDYLGPAGTSGTGRPRVLGDRGSDSSRKKSSNEGGKPLPRVGGLKLAPLPAHPAAEPPKPAEPAPQKPDIKLPLDVIRSKAGSKPLAEHVRQLEQKRKSETPGPRAPGAGKAGRGGATTDLPAKPGERPRRGGKIEEDKEPLKIKPKRTSTTRKRDEDEALTGTFSRRGPTKITRRGTNTAAPRKGRPVIELPCTVRTFSEAIGIPAAKVLGKLMTMNAPVRNINATLDPELVELLAVDLGVEVEFKKPASLEEQVLAEAEAVDAPEHLLPRPPVVTFLGHVDHGKTSLLDRIIGIDVASGESGGITQHIRAYRVERDGHPIAFVDTPGHEAFTQMRARGAQVTDIAVLVVAADDGVMPQTEEAISHAKAANVPIVVALNKIDLPGVNQQRIYEQLAANDLLPSEWGGETEVVKCSALKGTGIDQLLETLHLTAELHNYQANPDRPASGTCLEAELHEGRGVVSKIIVQKGTLRVGDVVVCGSAFGKVKAMYDTLDRHKHYTEAGPSTPVNMTGLDIAPQAGDHFYVVSDVAAARQLAEKRASDKRAVTLGGGPTHATLETFRDRLNQLGDGKVATLNLILRADVRGSIEAIQKELSKLSHPEVQLKILQASVGGVSEADVHLADASDAIIIAFNVVPDEKARNLAERLGVQIRRYDIIYQVSDDLKAALEGLLKPEKRETDLGRALVLRAFSISRVGTVAGCRVLSGTIERNARVRVIRDNRIIGDYPLDSLKREKDDAREVREGFECGIKLSGFNDVKEGDLLEAYKVEEVARTI